MKNNKEAEIIIRVTLNLKETLKERAEEVGLSLSAFIRTFLIEKLKV